MSIAISIQNVHKSYGQFHALKGVSFDVKEGEFFGLLGPNGAGKTTLISLLAGLARPTQGQLKIMGYDVQNEYRAARLSLGVVPQELVFDPFFTTRLGKGGSGLGLHIVHNLVTGILGGRIVIDSELMRGTKFIMKLPKEAPNADAMAL